MRLHPPPLLLLLPLALLAAPVSAHPGGHHENLLATLWHLVSQPDHLSILVLALAVGTVAALIHGRQAR